MPKEPKENKEKKPRKKGSGGYREKAGRKLFKPTDEQREMVQNLSGLGVKIEDMTRFIKSDTGKQMCSKTLAIHFSEEIEKGRVKANATVAKSLFRNATEPSEKHPYGNTSAQIFWLKSRANWQESPQQHEISGKNGEPIAINQNNFDETDARANEIAARLESLVAITEDKTTKH